MGTPRYWPGCGAAGVEQWVEAAGQSRERKAGTIERVCASARSELLPTGAAPYRPQHFSFIFLFPLPPPPSRSSLPLRLPVRLHSLPLPAAPNPHTSDCVPLLPVALLWRHRRNACRLVWTGALKRVPPHPSALAPSALSSHPRVPSFCCRTLRSRTGT
eukprot:364968-Chlamydomonas_euryale.AAC.7